MTRVCLRVLVFILLFFGQKLASQETSSEKRYNIHTLAFYNLENSFDTINDPFKFDEASPMMEIRGDRDAIYRQKTRNMARVISEIGADLVHNSPAIIGVCEIENRQILVDIVNDSLLVGKDYGIIHFESPDARGIDVGLIYQKRLFQPIDKTSYELKIFDDKAQERVYTRDQLLVSGKLDGELIHIIVNHWPSRRGGEARSRPKRMAAAKLNKRLVDSLHSINPYAKIVIMGDLNDDPTNASVKDVLGALSDRNAIGLKGIYNPMENFFKQGLGTTAYRDSWSLFDQIMVTKPLIERDYSSYRFYRAGIFNKTYLTNPKGRYKGYPLRSFADGGFTGGFSDHFPVYIYLIKEATD